MCSAERKCAVMKGCFAEMNYEEIKKQGLFGVKSWNKYKNNHYLWSLTTNRSWDLCGVKWKIFTGFWKKYM